VHASDIEQGAVDRTGHLKVHDAAELCGCAFRPSDSTVRRLKQQRSGSRTAPFAREPYAVARDDHCKDSAGLRAERSGLDRAPASVTAHNHWQNAVSAHGEEALRCHRKAVEVRQLSGLRSSAESNNPRVAAVGRLEDHGLASCLAYGPSVTGIRESESRNARDCGRGIDSGPVLCVGASTEKRPTIRAIACDPELLAAPNNIVYMKRSGIS